METIALNYQDISARASASVFTVPTGVSEYNIIIESTDPSLSFSSQAAHLAEALERVLNEHTYGGVVVFKRYFLSDPTNQAPCLPAEEGCAVSLIGQAPLNGTKVALWTYVQTGMTVTREADGLYAASHGAYRHLWCGNACAPDLHSELATMALFGDYVIKLDRQGCDLLDNCLRTWFFVRDIDVNYRGVVVGRNDVFRRSGLTPLTHFIASTGINGINANTAVTVTMDAYAVDGITPRQVKYLHAADFLNPTVEYGVAFERGTAIEYGDRRHVLISGTASINNKGEVMYPGDIAKQTQRVIDNIEALLHEADCQLSDMTHLIVYLRDTADYQVVKEYLDAHFSHVPTVIVLAAVCRPGWLIEAECMAIKAQDNAEYAPL